MAENRLTTLFRSLRARHGKALALFLTAGFPAAGSTPGIALSLSAAGADIIELGMPFSDPLADGPVIQQSSTVALANGTTIATILEDVRSIRVTSSVPIVLMGYLNPILSYGPGRFFSDCASAGVDGVILPELSLEESVRFRTEISQNSLCNILLVAPTTPGDRVKAIDAVSSGFLYCVSTTGVTGGDGKGVSEGFLSRVKENAPRNPVLVGFGISTAEHARHAASVTDGVIIGSALIRKLAAGETTDSISEWVTAIRSALASA